MRKWPFFLLASGASLSVLPRLWAQTGSRPSIVRPPFVPPPFVPPRPWPAPLTELRLEKQSAQVEIGGPLARVHLRQTLRNASARALEGSYLFALPSGAAVSNFAMTMNGKRLEAEVLEGDKAREIYQGIVQKLRDPAILEFVGRDLLRAKVFPVPAGGSVEIELDYAQTLTGNRFTLPLRGPNGASDAKASVEVKLRGADLRAVYSPSHQVEVRRPDEAKIARVSNGPAPSSASGGDQTLVSGEFPDSTRDFTLLWTRGGGKVGLDLLTTPPDGNGDGYFLLLAAPDPALTAREVEAKDVVFVMDTSGSMSGPKIEQARRALQTLLGDLNPGDRFNIITFASSVNPFRDALVPASAANLQAARDFAAGIKAVGGTNISDALQSALGMTGRSARAAQIVFLTDGQPTVGQTDADAILGEAQKENAARARVFTFGLGYDVNARLLDGLASDNRGSSDYVTPDEDIEEKVGALYEKIAYPVLSDPKVDFGALGAYDVYPAQLPDLFRGSQAIVMGRYRGDARAKIVLAGQSSGQTLRFDGTSNRVPAPEVPKLWASRKIAWLIDDARRQNRPVSDEARDEIVQLSRKYGIVTPFTAALITEDEATSSFARPAPMLGSIPFNGSILQRGGARKPSRASEARQDAGAIGGAGGSAGGGTGAAENGVFAAGRFIAPSGAAGVAASQATQALRDGRADALPDVKTVAGKTFQLRDGVWTDSAFDAQKAGAPRVVKFASDEYFALAKDAQLAQWLSVGPRVLVLWNGKPLQIEP